MKVGELINELQLYPKDMVVVIGCDIVDKEDFSIIEEFYNGDSANPNCEIINNVLRIGY